MNDPLKKKRGTKKQQNHGKSTMSANDLSHAMQSGPAKTRQSSGKPGCPCLDAEDEFCQEEVVVPNGKGPQCPCFVAFLRVLLCYLKKRGDMKSYFALRQRLQLCTEKSRRHEPGYECVAQAVLNEIPEVIKLSDLRRVQAIIRARVQQKKKLRKTKATKATKAVSTECAKFDNVFKQGQETA